MERLMHNPFAASGVTAPARGANASEGLRVFIDFDNTISIGDVLDGVVARFAADESWRVLEDEWAAGRIGARACLAGQLHTLRVRWPDLRDHLDGARIDPGFVTLRDLLRRENVELTIVSDSFDRFILPILQRHGL